MKFTLYMYLQVIGAKVVTNARTPGSRCYGYVTMASAQDAESCIKNLHRTGQYTYLIIYILYNIMKPKVYYNNMCRIHLRVLLREVFDE